MRDRSANPSVGSALWRMEQDAEVSQRAQALKQLTAFFAVGCTVRRIIVPLARKYVRQDERHHPGYDVDTQKYFRPSVGPTPHASPPISAILICCQRGMHRVSLLSREVVY
jgi:hypothetical protein